MKITSLLSLFLIATSFFAQKQNQSIGFIENKGQIVDQNGKANAAVKYLLNTKGLNVQLRKNGFSYDIYETNEQAAINSEKTTPLLLEKYIAATSEKTLKYNYHRIDIDFVNSNVNVELIAEQKSSDFNNYFNVVHAPDGILEVHKYQKVTYKNIYDHIDIVFFIPEDIKKPVEYNFIIRPEGNVSDIQLQFNGARTNLVDNKIKMKVRFGVMEETLPLSYNEADKEVLDITYKKIHNNIYGFDFPKGLKNKTIIIDPVPIRLWGTYYGGSGTDYSESMDFDVNNNVYISGYSTSPNNIATAGSYLTISTGNNGFVAKLDPNGNRIWGSYYRYSTMGMKLDPLGNIYIYGKTLSANPNIPSVGCFQSIKNNYNDTYLIKLNNNGFKIWGTFYGGNENETIHSITFDSLNNVYIVGETNSSDVFSSPGAHQVANASTASFAEGFIAKFDSSGNRIWGTFYGGTQSDGFYYCKVSNNGYLYMVGTTRSSTAITTSGSYQSAYVSGYTGMIIKFDLNGQRIWGTYTGNDAAVVGAVLKDDELLFHGITYNQNGIGTPNTLYPTLQTATNSNFLSTNENSYVVSFNVQTQQKNWGTYFVELIATIDLNQNHDVYFSGHTNLDTAIATTDGYMPVRGFYIKTYLVKLNTLGQRVWGTYYGGNQGEQRGWVKIDNNNDILLYGTTFGSTTGIATINANQTVLGSNPDTYLVKFRDCLSVTTTLSNSPLCIGNTIQLTASGGTNYTWTGPNSFSSNLQNPIILNATIASGGLYSCAITGTSGCDATNTITVVVGDTTVPTPNVSPLPNITGDCTTTLIIPTALDNCAGVINATTADPLSYPLPGNYTVHWTYDDGNGNTATQNQTVTINPVALPLAVTPQTFCIQQNATLNSVAIFGQNIKWYDAPMGGNLLTASTVLVNGSTYYASQTINTCESFSTPITISIQNTSAPTGNSSQSFCSTQNPTLNDMAITGTNINWYNSATSTNPLPLSTILTNATYYATQTQNSCESNGRLPITVTLINTLNANDYAVEFCDDLNDNSETVNLSAYNSNLISNPVNCTFTYYNTLLGATNQNAFDQITNPTNVILNQGITIIYVRITSNNGCSQIVKLTLTVFLKPTITIRDIEPICENLSITINAGNGFDSYLWSTGETSQSILVLQPGNYFVTVTDNHNLINCSSTKNFTVVLSNKATIKAIETLDWTETENTIAINVTGFGDYEYSIDGSHYQNSPVFNGLPSGSYMVYVRDKNGCGVAQDEVFLLMYPKFFTPNNDAVNDTWKIKFSQYEPNLKVKIYDRYGKLIKDLDNKLSWDGNYNGSQALSDDYWFVVTRINGKEHKGHFTLKR